MRFSICIEVAERTGQQQLFSARRELALDGDHTNASDRPLASFVAHLIATCAQAPQTRTLRRCDPQEAIEAYRAQFTPLGKHHFPARSV